MTIVTDNMLKAAMDRLILTIGEDKGQLTSQGMVARYAQHDLIIEPTGKTNRKYYMADHFKGTWSLIKNAQFVGQMQFEFWALGGGPIFVHCNTDKILLLGGLSPKWIESEVLEELERKTVFAKIGVV